MENKKWKIHWTTVLLAVLVLGIIGIMSGCRAADQIAVASQTTQTAPEVVKQPAPSGTIATLKGDYQEVAIDLKSNSYGKIIVQRGIPVKFNIRATAETINGCNNVVVFPDFGKELSLKPGDNIVEFTPEKTGDLGYSCWMGMIYSQIKVVDDLNDIEGAVVSTETVESSDAWLGESCNQCN